MKKIKINENVIWVLFLLPAFLCVVTVLIVPILMGFIYSFTDWNGLAKEINFIGFHNYTRLFQDKQFLKIMGNTLKFSFTITIFQNIIGLFLATMVVKDFRTRNFFRVIFYLPAVLSSLVVSYSWSFILDANMGAVNKLLDILQLDFLAQDWLGNPRLVLFVIAAVVIWQFSGYSMLIYMVGLGAIPEELYEAVDLEGASKWKRFTKITVPLLAPSFTINIVLTLISTMKSFEHVYAMSGGGPGYASELISIKVYKEAFANYNMGYASAISAVLFLMISVLSFVLLGYLRKKEEM